MKKIFLLATVSILILTSCEKDDKPINEVENIQTENLIYKRPENYISTSSVFDKHIISITKLFNNSKESIKIKKVLKSKKINTFLDLNTIKLSLFDNTEAKMFSVNSLDKTFTLTIYELDGNYLFQKIIKEHNKGLTHFASYNLENKLLYSLDINSENKVGNRKVGKGNIKYDAILTNNPIKKSMSEKQGASCTETTSSFGDCMLCGIHECWDDWVCAVVMGVDPELVFSGFAIGCAAAQL
jgi:hypothetical protein